MKRCPTCERTFEDEMLTVCPDDGAMLVSPVSANVDLGGKATWSASVDQIPELQKYVAATTVAPRTRKVWPIVAAVAALLLLGAVVLIAIIKMR